MVNPSSFYIKNPNAKELSTPTPNNATIKKDITQEVKNRLNSNKSGYAYAQEQRNQGQTRIQQQQAAAAQKKQAGYAYAQQQQSEGKAKIQQRTNINSNATNSSSSSNVNATSNRTTTGSVSNNSSVSSNSSTKVTQGFGSASSITQKAYSVSGKTGRITAPDMTKKTDGMTYTKIQNPDGCTIDEGAISIKKSIEQIYDQLNYDFKNLAKEFNKIAQSGVCGRKLKEKISVVSDKCKKQGGYCIDRKQEMNNLFKYSNLESKINELESKLNQIIK